ncbi:MAG TPA: hypothetical protein VG187_14990, partial [Mycobacterium sp.]|nr:hypothetical protein [Mycobacterium sp.]
ELEHRLGQLHVMVNNAGIQQPKWLTGSAQRVACAGSSRLLWAKPLFVEILGRVVRPNAESVAADRLGQHPTGDPWRGADHRCSRATRAA